MANILGVSAVQTQSRQASHLPQLESVTRHSNRIGREVSVVSKLSFLELAQKVLEECKTPMTAEEIWAYSKQKGYDAIVGTKGKTPWQSIRARIYCDMRDNPDSPFVKIQSRPSRFIVKHAVGELQLNPIIQETESLEEEPQSATYHERDLHPFFSYFANLFLGIHTKTIYHEKSSKKSYTQWLHPDLVGVKFPIEEWEPEVLDFGLSIGSQLVTLYSFEMKKE